MQRFLVVMVGLLLLANMTVFAQDESVPVQSLNGVSYATGGIGSEEVETLKTMESQFNLKVVSAHKDSEYSGNIALIIRDKSGKQMLNITTNGPLFYAKLPAGDYVVEAVLEQQRFERKLHIGKTEKLQTVYFTWK